MTTEQAKEILLAYRPWTDDAQDPEIAAALTVMQSQPELQRWLEAHCERQLALRDKFRAIQAPEGLLQQILSERRVQPDAAPRRRRVAIGALACGVMVVALAFIVQTLRPVSSEDLSFNGYRQRMVKTVLRAYGMDFETNEMTQVRAFLGANRGLADFALTPGLTATPTVGCGVLRWQGQPVTMVCFRTGKPLPPGSKSDLFLFVVAAEDVDAGGVPQEKVFAQVSELVTASWREGGKIYLLAGFTEEDVRQRL